MKRPRGRRLYRKRIGGVCTAWCTTSRSCPTMGMPSRRGVQAKNRPRGTAQAPLARTRAEMRHTGGVKRSASIPDSQRLGAVPWAGRNHPGRTAGADGSGVARVFWSGGLTGQALDDTRDPPSRACRQWWHAKSVELSRVPVFQPERSFKHTERRRTQRGPRKRSPLKCIM